MTCSCFITAMLWRLRRYAARAVIAQLCGERQQPLCGRRHKLGNTVMAQVKKSNEFDLGPSLSQKTHYMVHYIYIHIHAISAIFYRSSGPVKGSLS